MIVRCSKVQVKNQIFQCCPQLSVTPHEEYKSENWIGLLGWGRRYFPGHSLNESIHAIVGAPMVSRSGGPSGLNMVPNLSFEGIWLEGETNLADGEWHHLVWTFAGKFNAAGEPEMTCYCDGKPEELLVGGMDPDRLLHWPPRIDTVVDHEDSVPLILGGSLLSIDDRQSLVPGELDEVYVIEGAIDAVAARRLFLENRYEPAPPKQIPLAETQAAEK